MKEDDDVVVSNNHVLTNQIPLTHIQLPLDLFKLFHDYLKLSYDKNEELINKNEMYEIRRIFNLGLIQANKLFTENTILIHKDKKPRKDVLKKFGIIATEFLRCSTYPMYPSSEIWSPLNKALGDCDDRVRNDYKNTVLTYCTKTSKFGNLDVSTFVGLIPRKYIGDFSPIDSTTSSSFNEE